MSTYRIPSPTEEQPRRVQRTALDGMEYILTFDWNTRDQHWYCDIANQDGDLIRAGVKLVVDWLLLRLVTDAERPPGALILGTSDGVDPDLTGLQDAVLRYLDVSEVSS